MSYLEVREHILFREGYRMEQKDLMSYAESQNFGDLLSADKAGRIVLVDIEKMDLEVSEFTKDGVTRKVTRYLLTMKGGRKIRLAVSAFKQLNELMKQHQLVAFSVLKTGSNLDTKYSIAPELVR